MKTNAVNNVSFGYRLTPQCVAKLKEDYKENINEGEELLSNLMDTGNDKVIIDYAPICKDEKPKFIMTIPKYGIKSTSAESCKDLTINSAKTMEFNILRKKINKVYNSFFGNIKLSFLKRKLMKDFPHLKYGINYMVKSAVSPQMIIEYMPPVKED